MFDRGYLHDLRKQELHAALRLVNFDKKKILEIGAGDGFMASIMARTMDVLAIDVKTTKDSLFHVSQYDGRNIPFENETFDAVFSCHVLEHISNLDVFHAEMIRVLKPGGIGLHIVPSASWRLWTMLTHYPALPKIISWKLRHPGDPQIGNKNKGIYNIPLKAIIAPRHGESGNAITEVLHFRRAAWLRRMSCGAWADTRITTSDIFYTGYEVFGSRLPISARKKLSMFLGSSSFIIITKKGHN